MKYKWWFFGLLLFLVSLVFDVSLLQFFLLYRSSTLNSFFVPFTLITNGFFCLIIIGFILFVWKRTYFYRYFLSFGIFAVILWLVKILVQRPRPFIVLDVFPLIQKSGFSFPSGHAGFAFFSLMFVWKLFPTLRWFFLIVVIFISIARFYVGVHYVSDVVGAALLGLFFGSLFFKQKWLKSFAL